MARGRRRRGPAGAAVLQRLRERLERGWEPGVTLLTGEDRFHLDAAERALLRHLAPEGGDEFAITVVGQGRIDAAELVAAARSVPMFVERRVVLLREVGALEGDPAPLVAYMKAPPPRSHVLIRAPKLDLRRPLHKALLGGAQVLEFHPVEDPGAYEVRREIGELAARRGLRLGRGVADFLGGACGGELYRVSSELDKLAVWLGPGDRRQVELDDARQIVFGGGVWSGWEVANAVMERDLGAALVAVRRLLEAGEEPLRIVGGLAWRARTLLQGKAVESRGMTATKAAQAVRAWPREPFERALGKYSMEDLLGFPSRLLRADRFLKSRTLDPTAVLESLVRDLVEGARPVEST
jgi:DNA polymerase-3 subunit delta